MAFKLINFEYSIIPKTKPKPNHNQSKTDLNLSQKHNQLMNIN